jgi:hypothetical protein
MRRIRIVVVLLGSVALILSGCQSEQAQMEQLVKKTLKKEGIQGGFEPVVELTKKGTDYWIGTATYDDIIYDLHVKRDSSGDLVLERQMRPHKPPP